jgi:hypothetical protein
LFVKRGIIGAQFKGKQMKIGHLFLAVAIGVTACALGGCATMPAATRDAKPLPPSPEQECLAEFKKTTDEKMGVYRRLAEMPGIKPSTAHDFREQARLMGNYALDIPPGES